MPGQHHDPQHDRQHDPPPYAAVVLAGGRGERLGGADKASVELDGRTLLARALDAVLDATEVVVVGDPAPTDRPVGFTREVPRHGGPVAALLAGVDALTEPGAALVVVLAVDMPRLSAGTVGRLRAAAAGHDGAVLVDPGGRRQPALALVRSALGRARPTYEDQQSMALHRLLGPLDLVEVAARGREHRDVDTWADLRDLSEDPEG